MPLETDTRIQRRQDIAFSEINGETVMMDSQFEKYFGMKAVGTRIWQLLEEETSLQRLCDQLITEYEVDRAQCMEDVRPFLEALIAQDMVQRLD